MQASTNFINKQDARALLSDTLPAPLKDVTQAVNVMSNLATKRKAILVRLQTLRARFAQTLNINKEEDRKRQKYFFFSCKPSDLALLVWGMFR
jgi:hypothetical protein